MAKYLLEYGRFSLKMCINTRIYGHFCLFSNSALSKATTLFVHTTRLKEFNKIVSFDETGSSRIRIS